MKLAFIPFDSYGHMNACIGLAQLCRERGHQLYFIINKSWNGKLSSHGFVEQICSNEDLSSSVDDYFATYCHTLSLNSFDKIKEFESPGWTPFIDEVKNNHSIIKQILSDIKPDVIIVDHLLAIPSAMTAGVPWINLISCNRLYLMDDHRLPAGGSGYASYGDKTGWKRFRDEQVYRYRENWNQFNHWIQSLGAQPLITGANFHSESPYLNLYLCAEELDYTDIYPVLDNWRNIDCLIPANKEHEKFQIPGNLADKYDKMIYLSMGTLGSVDVELIKRLINILSNSRNEFIVSKGQFGDDIELSDNMWGQNSVKQLQVLPCVDLIITHGGNNTVTESLYFGKPMIVMPIFSDQYDNAQRIHEKRFGIRLDPYNCTQSQLLNAIETILNDNELKLRLELVSKRIQNSQSKLNAVKLIEKLVNNSKEV